jgi:predicted cupin superfamily sugar epimerase
MKAKIDSQTIIDFFGLEELPEEGGVFIQSYRSADVLSAEQLPARYQENKLTGSKPAGTAIYYLLTGAANSFSALHKLPTDEVYHFYLGDPVELLLLYPGGEAQVVILGQELLAGQHVQFVVPRGVWQGARLLPGGEFALLGTTMAPGWTDEDYEAGAFEPLLAEFPAQSELIRKLIRS